jgi:hypothetical protein
MRAPSVAGAVLIVALGACGRGNPDERFVDFGTETETFAKCTNGSKLDLDAARRRFDVASPGINASGATEARLRSELAAHGGVLISYAGRRYHSRYLSALTHNWRDAETAVLAEAIVPSVDRTVVFVKSPLWKKRRPDLFMPWSTPDDDAPVCR